MSAATLEAVREYRGRGWWCIPVPAGQKNPTMTGWPDLRLDGDDLRRHFSNGANVGVLNGEPSGWLIDMDLDADEAIVVAPHLLAPTLLRHGRTGKHGSHWWFEATTPIATRQFEDPTDGTMLLEVRSTSSQTLVPPSQYPGGGEYLWESQGEPTRLSGEDLLHQAARLAAAALLARHWPERGSRDRAAMALSGGLLRAGWSEEETSRFVTAVAVGAGDEEARDRARKPRHTASTLQAGEHATGWPTLARLVGDAIVTRACEWLGIRWGENADTAAAGGADDGRNQRKSQATILVGLAAGAELFHTPEGDAYATITVGGHHETHALKAKGFRLWLRRRYHEAREAAPSSQAVQDALGVLEGKALFDGAEHSVCTRIGEHNGAIYVDLTNDAWEVVQIDATGWRIVSDPPLKFRRTRGMLPLPHPTRGGSLDRLWAYVNVRDEATRKLVIGWLLQALRPRGPYPVGNVKGEQGSAKSTTTRVMRGLIDPNAAPLRREPRESRDLMIAAQNGWVVTLDNMSRLPGWLSDDLCSLATGGGFSTRELYSDADEVLFDAMRPVLMNAIEDIAQRGDLVDRLINIECPTISEEQRRDEATFWAEFERDRPGILGALLDAVSGAIRNLPNTRLERKPRLADFALWVTAAEPALGWESGSFVEVLAGSRKDANETPLEASLVAGPVIQLAESGGWDGQPAELLAKLNELVSEETRRLREWPKAANVLSGMLRRLAPNLRVIGVAITFGKSGGRDRRRIIGIHKIDGGQGPSVPPESSDHPGKGADGRTTESSAADDRSTETVRESGDPPESADGQDGADDSDGRDPTVSSGPRAGEFCACGNYLTATSERSTGVCSVCDERQSRGRSGSQVTEDFVCESCDALLALSQRASGRCRRCSTVYDDEAPF